MIEDYPRLALDFDGVVVENPPNIYRRIFECFDKRFGERKIVGTMYRIIYPPLSLNQREINYDLLPALKTHNEIYVVTLNSGHLESIIRKFIEQTGLNVKGVFALPPGERSRKYDWLERKLQELSPVLYVTDDKEAPAKIKGIKARDTGENTGIRLEGPNGTHLYLLPI